MPHLYKRGRIWWITDGSGKDRRRFSIGTVSEKVAERILQKYIDNKVLGKWGIELLPDPIDAKKFIWEYKKHVERISKPAWNTRQQQHIDNFADFLPAGIQLHEIKIIDIQEYIYKRMDYGLSSKTIRDEISTLNRMFQFGISHNYLKVNPCKDIQLPPKKRKGFPMFSKKQLKKIFSHENYGNYYKCLYYTGLRASDVSKLHSDNINRKLNCIELLEYGTEKTETPTRIPIHPKIQQITQINGYIFQTKPSWTPKKYAHAAYQVLKRIVDNEGWNPRLTIHSFRVTFNNHLRDLGVAFEDRQKLLTHSATRTTLDYTYSNLEYTRNLIEKL